MKLKGDFVLLNMEVRTGVKDPTKHYNILLMMQGTEPVETMASDEVMVKIQTAGIQRYQAVDCVIEESIKYNSRKVVEIDAIPIDKPKN